MRDPAAARRELARRELARRHLLDFVRRTYGEAFNESWHHRLLCEELERFSASVAAKQAPRLIVTMPPRHTKSTIVSERFPVWHMGRHPGHDVICASYSQDLANRLSRNARRVATDAALLWPDVSPSDERKAVSEWVVRSGGTYRAAGVGGSLTGMGAHAAVVDDPIKGWEEAQSATVRQRVKDWFTSVLMTRLAPGAGVLITQTRWHGDDLTGWQLREFPGEWQVFNFPAIAEEDEEHRRKGEALHPERYPLEGPGGLNNIRRTLGEMQFAALYQQRPVPAEGGIIKGPWLRANRYSERTHRSQIKRLIHSWDTASKAKEHNDPSLCWVLAERKDGAIEVWGRWKDRVVFPDLLTQIKAMHARDKPHVVLIEDKGSGQEAIAMLKRDRGFHGAVVPSTPVVDKLTRMATETPALESGRVLWPEDAPWLADAWDVLLTFPSHAHDEEVDALSQALRWIREGSDTQHRLRVLYGV